MNFHFNNWTKQNTPAHIEAVGNLFLLIGALGAVICMLPVQTPSQHIIVAYMAAIGTTGKILTKFFGPEKSE